MISNRDVCTMLIDNSCGGFLLSIDFFTFPPIDKTKYLLICCTRVLGVLSLINKIKIVYGSLGAIILDINHCHDPMI